MQYTNRQVIIFMDSNRFDRRSSMTMKDYRKLVDKQKTFFNSGATRSIPWRQEMLKTLSYAIEKNENLLLDALNRDLGKPATEAYASEIGFVLNDIDHAAKKLPKWARPRRRRISPVSWPGNGRVQPQPYGTSLILGPWNYPFQLILSPLISCMAAGNCAVVKPSEYAPATSQALAQIFETEFKEEYICIVQGERETAELLTSEDFDYIFFTGSAAAGKAVMSAAAKNLTPVTLELGGKCPCIVCEDANLKVAARRILWGKLLNSGQTCVAPDYVMVRSSVAEDFVSEMQKTLAGFFPETKPAATQLARIVNGRHFDRIVSYLDQGRIVAGGCYDRDKLYIEPTILRDPPRESAVMKEEIFGPVLPVLEFDDLAQEISKLKTAPSPLALYLFTESRRTRNRVIQQTRSGGLCVNDTISHLLNRELPFGGVGESGMGKYHGKAGFDCFTHYKSVLVRSTALDPRQRYWPVTTSLDTLRKVYRFLFR
jgi:aldehyde dehydrogenase (NAD+)